MAENVSNKERLVPVKVKVNQAGYPEALCSYIKGDGTREDLFIIDSGDSQKRKSDALIVTPDVVEALGRKKKTKVGVINPFTGEVLIPLENQDVIVASDDIYVVISNEPTTLEVKNAIATKSGGDFSRVSQLESDQKNIITQMNGLSDSFKMLFSDPFGEARAYKIKMNSNNVYCVEPLTLPASFIGMDGTNVYSHTNVLNSSVKTVAYNNTKTDDIAVVGDSNIDTVAIEPPVSAVADKIEMPVVEGDVPSKETSNVSSLTSQTVTYDKLFTGLEKPTGASNVSEKVQSVRPKAQSTIVSNGSPVDQLDKINSMLEEFVNNNPTDKLKKELRQARSKVDKLSSDLKDSMGLNKTLTSKCTDYQNESYALSATNKDLEAKLAQYKERNAEMKEEIAALENKLAQMSAKLSHTITLFTSLVGNSSMQLDDIQLTDSGVKRKAA
ncbi:MAG: hypothetical protein J6B89_01440 [Bacilli bacterium]|nr:hypothetical protein [Bacilli bacterium]